VDLAVPSRSVISTCVSEFCCNSSSNSLKSLLEGGWDELVGKLLVDWMTWISSSSCLPRSVTLPLGPLLASSVIHLALLLVNQK
jgi:hypothetical protein